MKTDGSALILSENNSQSGFPGPFVISGCLFFGMHYIASFGGLLFSMFHGIRNVVFQTSALFSLIFAGCFCLLLLPSGQLELLEYSQSVPATFVLVELD